jgi:RNA polymerase sigma-70 factor (ECF subfamily)
VCARAANHCTPIPTFEALHAQFEPSLRRFFARRLSGRYDHLDDLVQRTWVACWRALERERYDPSRAAISTFLYAVANNIWLQHLRRIHRENGHARADGAELDDAPDSRGGPNDAMEFSELLEAVRDCLGRSTGPQSLTPEERAVVESIAHGASERSVADKLTLAASTINAYKQSAYTKLRRCMRLKGFTAEQIERSGVGGE